MVRKREKGFALIVALFVMVITLSAGAMIAGSIGYRMWLVRQESRNLHLTAITDAGLSEALAELSVDPTYPGTQGAVPFGDGTFTILSELVGGGEAEVEVRATYAGGGRAARARVTLFPLRVTSWTPMGVTPSPPPSSGP